MALYSLHISVFLEARIWVKVNNLFGYGTNSNGSVGRLCCTCSIIELDTRNFVFDFFRLPTSIEFNGTMSSIDFDSNFFSVCLIRYVRP